MENQEFNGHTNWDTWNASLWINNEEWSYNDCIQLAKNSYNVSELAELLQIHFSNLKGDGIDHNNVDWNSIAEEFEEFI